MSLFDYSIEIFPGSLAAVAENQADKVALLDLLGQKGQNGWEAYQVSELPDGSGGQRLMVFYRKASG